MKCQESDLIVCARTLFGADPCDDGQCSLEEFLTRVQGGNDEDARPYPLESHE